MELKKEDLEKLSTEYCLVIRNRMGINIECYNSKNDAIPIFIIAMYEEGDNSCSLCDEEGQTLIYIDGKEENSFSIATHLLTGNFEDLKENAKIAIDKNDLFYAIGLIRMIQIRHNL